ncbi:ABC transporter substrate-binding protein [Streptomyces sp. P38-E01]|uniref:ABC transporter substrate-binding protein n=1 Tax=Streptomyces tardus TaxID=2780544 RepID=A0A949JF99_9ACTN|nr:ABC transporter substrate-binding protein [Streptomyces tardus]MBU7597434.1 ABC transporter substrate-binding protein [Streptomyces tardus]
MSAQLPLSRRQAIRAAAATGIAALAVPALSACGGSAASDGDGKKLKIGLLVSLSGTYKEVGTDMRDGFQLYLDLNDGKLGGREIELIIADEGDGPPTALPAANKLIKKDKVDVLTGIVGGGSVNAVLPLINKHKIPLVGSNARPEVKDVERVWHTSYLSDEPGIAIAEYIKKEVGGPVYAIGPDYQGGHDELRGFTETFAEVDGVLANPDGKTTWTPFPATTNFTPYFAKIAATDAKAVYCFYAGKAAIDFVKQYAQSDIADIPLYAAGFLTEGSTLPAQGKAAKDIYSVLNYAADLDNAANRKFAAAWTAEHDTQPTTFALASYDAAFVLDRAIADAAKEGEVNPESINKAIAALGKIDSPRGPWEFGEKLHAPVQKWYLRQVREDGDALANVVMQELATLGE